MNDLVYSHVVHRISVLLLLFILPIQFAWAVSAGYCGHEMGDGVTHFGHHEHQHLATQDGTSGEPQAAPSIGVDIDCGQCQFSGVRPGSKPAMASTCIESARLAYDARYESHISPGPERPERPASSPAVRFGGAVLISALLLA